MTRKKLNRLAMFRVVVIICEDETGTLETLPLFHGIFS